MTEIKTTAPETTGPIDSFLSEWTSAERAGDNGELEHVPSNWCSNAPENESISHELALH